MSRHGGSRNEQPVAFPFHPRLSRDECAGNHFCLRFGLTRTHCTWPFHPSAILGSQLIFLDTQGPKANAKCNNNNKKAKQIARTPCHFDRPGAGLLVSPYIATQVPDASIDQCLTHLLTDFMYQVSL